MSTLCIHLWSRDHASRGSVPLSLKPVWPHRSKTMPSKEVEPKIWLWPGQHSNILIREWSTYSNLWVKSLCLSVSWFWFCCKIFSDNFANKKILQKPSRIYRRVRDTRGICVLNRSSTTTIKCVFDLLIINGEFMWTSRPCTLHVNNLAQPHWHLSCCSRPSPKLLIRYSRAK